MSKFEMFLLFVFFLTGLTILWLSCVRNFVFAYIFGGIVGGECVKIFYDIREMRDF